MLQEYMWKVCPNMYNMVFLINWWYVKNVDYMLNCLDFKSSLNCDYYANSCESLSLCLQLELLLYMPIILNCKFDVGSVSDVECELWNVAYCQIWFDNYGPKCLWIDTCEINIDMWWLTEKGNVLVRWLSRSGRDRTPCYGHMVVIYW